MGAIGGMAAPQQRLIATETHRLSCSSERHTSLGGLKGNRLSHSNAWSVQVERAAAQQEQHKYRRTARRRKQTQLRVVVTQAGAATASSEPCCTKTIKPYSRVQRCCTATGDSC